MVPGTDSTRLTDCNEAMSSEGERGRRREMGKQSVPGVRGGEQIPVSPVFTVEYLSLLWLVLYYEERAGGYTTTRGKTRVARSCNPASDKI